MTSSSNVSSSFFDRIQPFEHFREIMEDRHYVRVPDDWSIVISDVKGSTKAIQENRYKDVNLVGAASITAVLNHFRGRSIPYVFGGDGATILVPESEVPALVPALIGTRELARAAFGLELRVGVVPLRDLFARGASIEVARYALSRSASITMMRGTGVGVAEKLVKGADKSSPYLVAGDNGVANFEGLSCRWSPVTSRLGEVICLIIMARQASDASATYRRVLAGIERILGQTSDAESVRAYPGQVKNVPVRYDSLDRKIQFSNLLKELRIQTSGKSLAAKAVRLLRILFEVAIVKYSMKTGRSLGKFNTDQYMKDLAQNSDFQKFDDMLRLIRDCSAAHAKEITEYLEAERASGAIYYGLHSAREAVLTCLVFDTQDDHVHFIDGGGGGYALAAKQLKSQIAAST